MRITAIMVEDVRQLVGVSQLKNASQLKNVRQLVVLKRSSYTIKKRGRPLFLFVFMGLLVFLAHIVFDLCHAMFTVGLHNAGHHIEVFRIILQRFHEII